MLFSIFFSFLLFFFSLDTAITRGGHRSSFSRTRDARNMQISSGERRKQKAKKGGKNTLERWHATFMPLYARVKFNEHSFSN